MILLLIFIALLIIFIILILILIVLFFRVCMRTAANGENTKVWTIPDISVFMDISTNRPARIPGWVRSRSKTRQLPSTTGTSGSPANAMHPTLAARLLDHDGRIIQILNNYAWMSFNFGPTLLSVDGSRTHQKSTEGIVEADQLSRARCGGHGNALAQVYNHVIMPLASSHDKETQVAWGIADFRHRFGREPEGMWLAETAVDIESLEVLAAAGIKFTILAPRQAQRWREAGNNAAGTSCPAGSTRRVRI